MSFSIYLTKYAEVFDLGPGERCRGGIFLVSVPPLEFERHGYLAATAHLKFKGQPPTQNPCKVRCIVIREHFGTVYIF